MSDSDLRRMRVLENRLNYGAEPPSMSFHVSMPLALDAAERRELERLGAQWEREQIPACAGWSSQM